jgi:hypothetical protein
MLKLIKPWNQKVTNCFTQDSKNRYVIVDIDQSFFTKNLSPDKFASQLITEGLSPDIQDIYLIVSEIENDHPLGVFAQQLTTILAERYQRKIKIHIPSYFSCYKTLLVPPDEDNKWRIFGINETNKNSYESLLINQNKKCVFENENLFEWLNNPQQTFDSVDYVWGE